RVLPAVALALLVCGLACAAGDVKSGPQPGASALPFSPLNVFNAENAKMNGQKNCLVCQSGDKAVAMIFAREINAPVANLITKLDAEVAKQGKQRMAAFVIFLSDDDKMEERVKELAEKHNIKNVSLAVDTPAGP